MKPEHDFGFVLARGQELRHEFMLQNPTGRPIRLLEAVAHTPCCSAVGSLPSSIPPGGTVSLPVRFRPGTETTHKKRVTFAIRTDHPEWPAWPLAVSATMTAEIEVRPVEGHDTSLPTGVPGRQRFRVICRRIGDEGRGAPDAVETMPSLVCTLGPARIDRPSSRMTETTRELDVTLPASPEIGSRRADVRLLWADGVTRVVEVAWQVTPRIAMSPAGLVLREEAGRASRNVVLRAADRPFRILRVSGPALVGALSPLPTESERLQTLQLDLDPSRVGAGATDLRIETDHPDQPAVTLGVVVIPNGRDAR